MTEKMRVCARSIDVDWMVDFGKARAIFDQHPNQPAICGNTDPVSVFYQGTPEMVYQATWKCLEEGGNAASFRQAARYRMESQKKISMRRTGH